MMKNAKLALDLQLFSGEGAGEGAAGEGANQTGDQATVDAEQRLRELGVPEEKIRKRAKSVAQKMSVGALKGVREQNSEAQNGQDAAVGNPAEVNKSATPARMSWEEIMADPEYNRQMQSVVQARLKSAKGAEETLQKLKPALEVLARKHGLSAENPDYEALVKKIFDDAQYYEDKALEMGVSLETAKKIDLKEREEARKKDEEEKRKAEEEESLLKQKFQQHISGLEKQGEEMKRLFPSFDLRKELQNPVFARLTSPNVGISVEDAYYAVHRKEIQEASMQATAQKTAEKISNAIRAGNRRPTENGTSGQAASVTTFDYRNATKEQREALKRRIYEAKARGEKIYPGK